MVQQDLHLVTKQFSNVKKKKSTEFLKGTKVLMTCFSAFWKWKFENLKTVSLTFFKLQSILSQSICGQRYSLIVLVHWGDNLQQILAICLGFC